MLSVVQNTTTKATSPASLSVGYDADCTLLPSGSTWSGSATACSGRPGLLKKIVSCVFLAASFCDPALLDQPMLEKALDAAQVPYTSVKFSENTAQFQPVREQAGAFRT